MMTRQILPEPNPVSSYWIRNPHPLADLRSTPDLPQSRDFAVVGAGLAGVLTAYHILKALDADDHQHGNPGAQQEGKLGRPRVVLLDARRACEGATGRNGGHVKVQVNTLLGLKSGSSERGEDIGEQRTNFQTYVGQVMQELKKIVEDEGIECEFELRRSFDVFTDQGDAERVYKGFEDARRMGEKWTGNVSWIGPEMAEQVTSIRGAKGAFSVPAASFWPYKFVTGLLEVMHQRWGGNGALNVQMGTAVTALSSIPSSSSTNHHLSTPRGTLTVPSLILATNAYTAGLLPTFKDRILPVRGMASHHVPTRRIHPHLTNTYNINTGPATGVDYLNQRPDGSIVVGGGSWLFAPDTPSWKGNWDDAHLFPSHATDYWNDYMQSKFLGWEESEAQPDAVWTGIMGRTVDGMPFVGRVPGKEGVWVLAGFNGGGMAVIAVCARAVGRMAVEGKRFEDVWREEGLLWGMRCCEERLRELVV